MGEAGIRNSDLRGKSIQLKIRKKQGPCGLGVLLYKFLNLLKNSLNSQNLRKLIIWKKNYKSDQGML